MHRVELSRRTMRSLRRIPRDRAQNVLEVLDELAALPDPATHHNVRLMKGDWRGCLRIRIGSYRAIFELIADPTADPEANPADNPLLISVVAVGPRGDIYKRR